ncbi:MAG TPA: 6,7-dimethyl-8-ribityllumazine synthase [Thermoplasmata archaeon]|nr:6,7-dimethyl-8-ribityllumazine synthase [Thermoplasmata archaeon]
MRLAIVAAQFNAEVTDRMVESALEQAKDRNVRVSTVVRVPGAFEIPLAVQALLRRDDVDAVVAIGAVIKGETLHDEAIMAAVCPALLELGLRESKPVGLGITGPGVTDEQAIERIRNAARAVDSVVAMYELMKGL